MSLIVRASAELIDRASSSRLNTSYGASASSRAHVMVRLTDDEGRQGYGEAAPLPSFTGETAASIHLQLRREFLPLVLGHSPFDLNAIHQQLDRLPENSSAKAAVDIALYDLMGKQAGLTVTQLLGGAVRPDVPVTFPLGIDDHRPELEQLEVLPVLADAGLAEEDGAAVLDLDRDRGRGEKWARDGEPEGGADGIEGAIHRVPSAASHVAGTPRRR